MPPVAPGGGAGPPGSSPVNTRARPFRAGPAGGARPSLPACECRARVQARQSPASTLLAHARRCLLALSGSASPLPLSARRHSEPRAGAREGSQGQGPAPGSSPRCGWAEPFTRVARGPAGGHGDPVSSGRLGGAGPGGVPLSGRRGARPQPGQSEGAAVSCVGFSSLLLSRPAPAFLRLLLSLPGVSGGRKARVLAKLMTCLCAKLTGGRTSTQTLPMASQPLRWRPRSPAPAPCRLQPRPTPTRAALAPRSTPELPGPGFSGPWGPGGS